MNDTSRDLRTCLVLFNLLFIVVPSIAAAHGTSGAAYAAGCLAMRVTTSLAAANETRKKPLVTRGERARLHTDRRGRCLINEIAVDCHEMAKEVERAGGGIAGAKRALLYYNKACELSPRSGACEDAKRVAARIGCEDPEKCEDASGTPLPTALDRAATRTAFADAVDRVVSDCDNDAPETREVEVAIRFAPHGRAMRTTVGPELAGSLIAQCMTDVFNEVRVPPFEGESQLVKMTVSLEDVAPGFEVGTPPVANRVR